jgi:hypothetical protein
MHGSIPAWHAERLLLTCRKGLQICEDLSMGDKGAACCSVSSEWTEVTRQQTAALQCSTTLPSCNMLLVGLLQATLAVDNSLLPQNMTVPQLLVGSPHNHVTWLLSCLNAA